MQEDNAAQHHIPFNSINFYKFDSLKRVYFVYFYNYMTLFFLVIGLTGNRTIPSVPKKHGFF